MATPTTSESAAAAWYCPSCEREYPTALAMCPNDGTRLIRVTDRDPLIGQTLDDRFVIRERLGAGGMGVVYRAWQTSVGREVAVKVIRTRAGDSSALVKRFLREAKLSSQLSQPSTVSVIDFGQTDEGMLYLVMELLRGRTLGQLIEGGALPPERAVRIAIQICDALDAAHTAGIIHRDLKPANVMVLDEPVGRDPTKVLDFGLAKAIHSDESSVTQSGRLVGTPTHLAPEVALGGDATAASDLYALGVMLYEMLAGRAPFSAPEVSTMVMMHAYHTAPELDGELPAPLVLLVERLLAKKPEDRPRSAAELRGLLEAAMAPGAAAQPSRWGRGRAAAKKPARGVTLASTTTNQALVPSAPNVAPPSRTRRVIAIGAVGLIAAAAIGFVVARPGSSPSAPAASDQRDAAAAIDAGPIDAAAPDAAPLDAAAVTPAIAPIDAGRRAPSTGRRASDARESSSSSPPPIDASLFIP